MNHTKSLLHHTISLTILLVLLPQLALAGPLTETVERLNLDLLQQTFDDAKVKRVLDGHGRQYRGQERQAAAVLIALGALEPVDLDQRSKLATKLDRYCNVLESNHTAFAGRIGDASLMIQLGKTLNYETLLAEQNFLNALGEKLSDGVITGYDVRRKGVYDGFPASHTFVYSHSSPLHLQQLATLMHSENINGWLYVTPKVSAFLFRDDWGPASDNVITLPSGVRVVQGREMAALFQFDSADDRYRFDELITRYAKKDEKDEKGLIANAWWQPFYYTDTPIEGFEPISLVVVTAGDVEATLTVLEEKTDGVYKSMSDKNWQTRIDRVWVNPPFYRFLNGDYR